MLARIIATVCFIGYMRPAPGTWGSIAGLALGALLASLNTSLFFVMIPIIILVGWWATTVMTYGQADHDKSEIVIDEVAGQMIALSPVVIGATHMNANIFALYPGWIAAFILFRLFDIWKPSLIGWADRMDTSFGVILDDIIAGIFAAFSVGCVAAITHWIIL